MSVPFHSSYRLTRSADVSKAVGTVGDSAVQFNKTEPQRIFTRFELGLGGRSCYPPLYFQQDEIVNVVFATFAHAISSTNPTNAINTASG